MAALVDFHTHFFSRTFFETLAGLSPLEGTPEEKLERATRSLRIELPAPVPADHLSRWLGEMDRHGVAHMVTFASLPQEHDVVAEAVAASGGRLSGFAILDPGRPEAPERLEELLGERGYRGALLFPAMHRFALDGPQADAVFSVLGEHGAPVIVHCGLLGIPLRDRLGLPRGYDLTLADPLRLVPAADRHPHVTFVLPHFGGGFLRETLMLGAQCPNVCLDTSSSNSWVRTQVRPLTLADLFERVLGVFGPERILFGTDSSTFPRGWRRDLFLAQREALGACGVRPEDQARIFGVNAARLLRLEV